MGYTHYWYRELTISQETYSAIVKDFKEFLPLFKTLDVQLANGFGEGQPIITDQKVIFNGNAHCGHTRRNLGITWAAPVQHKSVIALNGQTGIAKEKWFAGAMLNERMCDGDCSHETFAFPRTERSSNPCELEPKPVSKIAYYKENGTPVYNRSNEIGKYFNFCKTAFKPYDFAVCVFLIIAKHHLGNKIIVSSDGETKDWQDAMDTVKNHLGYDFKLAD